MGAIGEPRREIFIPVPPLPETAPLPMPGDPEPGDPEPIDAPEPAPARRAPDRRAPEPAPAGILAR